MDLRVWNTAYSESGLRKPFRRSSTFRAEGFPLFLNELLKSGTRSAFQVDFLKALQI